MSLWSFLSYYFLISEVKKDRFFFVVRRLHYVVFVTLFSTCLQILPPSPNYPLPFELLIIKC